MGIQESYNTWSSTYDTDRNLTRDLDESALRDAFIGGLNSPATPDRPAGALTLEIGCGTGKNTGFLAQVSGRVLALDFSQGMLSAARKKVTAANVAFCQADLTRPWPARDASVDRIACDLVLEHIADLSQIFGEAARCLLPGGSFYVSELHPFRQYQGAKARYEDGAGRFEIQAYVHHVSDFLRAARAAGLALADLRELWHAEDENKPPRLITLLFTKA